MVQRPQTALSLRRARSRLDEPASMNHRTKALLAVRDLRRARTAPKWDVAIRLLSRRALRGQHRLPPTERPEAHSLLPEPPDAPAAEKRGGAACGVVAAKFEDRLCMCIRYLPCCWGVELA